MLVTLLLLVVVVVVVVVVFCVIAMDPNSDHVFAVSSFSVWTLSSLLYRHRPVQPMSWRRCCCCC